MSVYCLRVNMADDNQKQAGSAEKEAEGMSSASEQNLSIDGQNIKDANNCNNLDLAAKSSDVEDKHDYKENDPDDENESKTDKSSVPFYKVSIAFAKC